MNKFRLALVRKISQKHSAFSLPEIIVTLIIIGVLAAILFPVISKAKPDENEVMHKKATFILERVVSELVTDEFLYPKNSEIVGLGNLSTVTVNGEIHEGESKFCTLFASRINKAANSKVDCGEGAKSVTSAEGIDWYLPISNFRNNDFEIVKVDVNGSKGPNCQYDKDNCKRPDQFTYQVRGGTRIPTKIIGNLDPTAPPPAKPAMPGAPEVNEPAREGLKWWSITCKVFGSGTVLGVGENKPNGQYQLVAIPKPGYVGTWLTKNVTVKNANYTDCDVTFSPIDKCMIPGVCDGNPDTPVVPPDPPTPPTPDDEEKTYCINKVVTGETAGCSISGTNPKECGLSSGTHNLTATVKEGYEGSWKDNKYTATIVDKDVTATLNCTKKEEEEKCYNITASITGQCSVDGAGCKPNGAHSLTITPSDNYTYNNSKGSSSYQVIVNNADVNVNITCTPPPKPEDEVDPCCETAFGSGAKYIAKSSVCVRDLGVLNSEAVNCKTDKRYCKGILSAWQYPSTYASGYKACLDINMDIPSKSKFLELYNNRQSAFVPSHWYTPNRESGYYTNEGTLTLPGYVGTPEHLMVHVPYDNQPHYLAVRNDGGRVLCWASAPAICATSPGPDGGSDDAAINVKLTTTPVEGVHKSSMNYTVTWSVNGSPLSKGKKYKVNATGWVTGTSIHTYYGVTTTTSGSYNGTITGIPSYIPSNQVKLTVTFY